MKFKITSLFFTLLPNLFFANSKNVNEEHPLMKLRNPSATNLDRSSLTISGEPDSPDVGQNFLNISVAQIVPGG